MESILHAIPEGYPSSHFYSNTGRYLTQRISCQYPQSMLIPNICLQDSVAMSSPGAFETALIAVTGGYEINGSPAGMSNWTSTGTNTGCFQQSGSVDKLCVTITSSHTFSVIPENLVFTSFSPMKGAKTWTRVAVRISQAVTSAWIKVVYYDPANPPTGI